MLAKDDPEFSTQSKKPGPPAKPLAMPWAACLTTVAALAGWFLAAYLLRNHYH